jgi:DNA-binding transcriptional ArsR family regulator
MATVGHQRRRRLPGRLSDEAIEVIAERLRVIADPTRIRLMELLNQHEGTVQELTDQLRTTHQNTSKHLAVLHQAGIVGRHRDGSRVTYQLADWTGWWLIEQISGSIIAHYQELQAAFSPPDTEDPQ